ncbi:MAG: LLM class flavin-dependent oxidoreductase [Chloroflexi bacterium]|nr:LLM class flavin-dependent oxidoreductase [Chloroflexota bacterium]
MVFSGVALTGASVEEHVRTAVEAERDGYTTGWVTEVSGADAVTVMAAAAIATTTLRLSTGIVSTYVRSPYLAAMTFHSLADLSGGRVAAGFGTSTPAIVTGWHGIPFERPLATTREFVDLFRKLLAGERVKSSGRFEIRGASLRGPAKGGPMRVYLAALNDGMLSLAGEIADGVILNFPTPGYARHALEVLDASLARAGRSRESFEVVANFRAGTGDFDGLANVLRRELVTYLLAPVYQKVFTADGFGDEVKIALERWGAGDRATAVSGISDAFVDEHSAFGTEEEVLARVQGFLDLGIDSAVLFPVVADGPDRKARELATIRALGPRTH